MSLPDANHPVASPIPEEPTEEMTEALPRTLLQALEQMNPVVRLRLMAFLHLIEAPGALKASLEFKPAGQLRLTLDMPVAPAKNHQH